MYAKSDILSNLVLYASGFLNSVFITCVVNVPALFAPITSVTSLPVVEYWLLSLVSTISLSLYFSLSSAKYCICSCVCCSCVCHFKLFKVKFFWIYIIFCCNCFLYFSQYLVQTAACAIFFMDIQLMPTCIPQTCIANLLTQDEAYYHQWLPK